DPTPREGLLASGANPAESGDDLERQVGENWFAIAGVVALTAGAGYMLSLPYPSAPLAIPSLSGYAIAVLLIGLAHRWRGSFERVAGYLRGVAMTLLAFATLRLFYPADRAALEVGSVAGSALLLGALATNVVLGLRQQSPWLMGIALATGGLLLLGSGASLLI